MIVRGLSKVNAVNTEGNVSPGPILAALGLNFDAYETLPMLYYLLKHDESPLGIISTQTPLFHNMCKTLKIKFTIRIVNSWAKLNMSLEECYYGDTMEIRNKLNF